MAKKEGKKVEEVVYMKPEKLDNKDLPIHIVLCFDGTGDTSKGSVSVTDGKRTGTTDSIRLIFEMSSAGAVYHKASKTEAYQIVKYFDGVASEGEDDNRKLTRFRTMVAGATGLGCLDILRKAYKFLCETVKDPSRDKIFIFGFSRGAFISRGLASFLERVGLIVDHQKLDEAGFTAKFNELLYWYGSKNKEIPGFCRQSPPVRFLGAFDTVKAVYQLRVTNWMRGDPTVNFEMEAPKQVQHFRHVLALNEERPLFSPDVCTSGADTTTGHTYEEAWFLGHHHDIGGGSENAGLSLHPLQWVLEAAKTYGLVLDDTHNYHVTVISGKPKTVRTPGDQDITVNMYDMIERHLDGSFLPLLNPPSTMQPYDPRNYKWFLEKKTIHLKTFVHPSAYLIFDLSVSFRIQAQGWKYINEFMKGRNTSVAQGAPWWEENTRKTILDPIHADEKFNILVYGRSKTGKATIIKKGFGKSATKHAENNGKKAKEEHIIKNPISVSENDLVNIHYFNFGDDLNDEEIAKGKEFLESNTAGSAKEKIHTIWYFHDCRGGEMSKADKDFMSLDFKGTPVQVILAHEDQLVAGVLSRTYDTASYMVRSGGAVLKGFPIIKSFWGDEPVPEVTMPETPIERRIREIQEINPNLKSFVHPSSPNDTFRDLYRETFASLPGKGRMALVNAQRAMVKSTIALANNKTVRAYTIWYSNQIGEKARHPKHWSEQEMMSKFLMEPILKTFNMRFRKTNPNATHKPKVIHKIDDVDFIYNLFKGDWARLEVKANLTNTDIPVDLILTCMTDVIMLMTWAHYFKQDSGTATAFNENDLTDAFKRYKDKRNDLHGKIKALLNTTGEPIDGSIATFQMELFAVMREETDAVEDASLWFWQKWYSKMPYVWH